jgi:hypothetical protein
MCDKEKNKLCDTVSAYPSHFSCNGDSCHEVGKGFKTSDQIKTMLQQPR